MPCTFVLDDPAGASYIESLIAPLDDDRLKKEFYTRTFEQDDELGLNDMKVENYQNKFQEIQEEEDLSTIDEDASSSRVEELIRPTQE